jgi:hypothetical protein
MYCYHCAREDEYRVNDHEHELCTRHDRDEDGRCVQRERRVRTG